MAGDVQMRVDRAVAILTIDHPPVNALSEDVMQSLSEHVDRAHADPTLRALVLTGAGKSFVAGADITRLERIARGEQVASGAALSDLIRRLEASDKPSVAAIDGFALGGGLELAMGCHARVATRRARIGLPELRLGLIPGAGGTQRLPRLIGLPAAIEVMLEKKQLVAERALELGALDEIVDSESSLERAIEVALELANGARPLRRSLLATDKLPPFEQAEEIVARARARAVHRERHAKHPSACLDAILAGLEQGAEAGLQRERELFLELLASDSARALIHVFFAERAAAKLPGVTDGEKVEAAERVVVIGGGTMGSGIATALLTASLDVTVCEVSEELARRARQRIENNVKRGVTRGRLSPAAASQLLERLVIETGRDGVGTADVVIEAATEDVGLKSELFSELAQATPATTLLASNTSTIGIDVLARAAGAPERVIGMHFFSPAHVMKLVEIVRTAETPPRALAAALALCKKLGKTPVTVMSCTGFLVNRVFMPYSQVAGFLIDRGVDPYRLDRALLDFGMPMGPCRMSDLAGIDVGLAAGGILDAAYPDRGYRSALRRLLVEAGRLGEKSGRGHYVYQQGNAIEDPELGRYVLRARELAGSPEPIDADDDELVRMMLFGVVNEACRAIEEGIVVRSSDIDVASILGMGFPAWRGGVLFWADRVGPARVHDALRRWHERFEIGLFCPSDHLARVAASSGSLAG